MTSVYTKKMKKSVDACSKSKKKGFQFDVGPTIVMMPEVFNEVFEYSGVNPKDYIDMTLLNPFNTIYYADQTKLEISSELPALVKQLEAFGPKETEGYLTYLAEVYGKYQRAKFNFLDKSYRNPFEFFNIKSMHQVLKLKTLNSAYSSISKYVKDEKTQTSFIVSNLIYWRIPLCRAFYLYHHSND